MVEEYEVDGDAYGGYYFLALFVYWDGLRITRLVEMRWQIREYRRSKPKRRNPSYGAVYDIADERVVKYQRRSFDGTQLS